MWIIYVYYNMNHGQVISHTFSHHFSKHLFFNFALLLSGKRCHHFCRNAAARPRHHFLPPMFAARDVCFFFLNSCVYIITYTAVDTLIGDSRDRIHKAETFSQISVGFDHLSPF